MYNTTIKLLNFNNFCGCNKCTVALEFRCIIERDNNFNNLLRVQRHNQDSVQF